MLKHEVGVHRVQRVPVTEGLGRVHTSTMSVVILPQPTQVDCALTESSLLDTVDGRTILRQPGGGGCILLL